MRLLQMYTLVQTHIVVRLFYFIHIILQSYDVFRRASMRHMFPWKFLIRVHFQDTTRVLLFVFTVGKEKHRAV